MALVECPECGREVSTLAVACPHCGYPIARRSDAAGFPMHREGPSRWTDPGFWIILAGLGITIVLSALILLGRVG